MRIATRIVFNKKEDSKEVYIFPESGRKYHNKSCQCLNPACEKVYITPAIKSRFKQCDICKKKGYKGNQAVFCFFHSGEVYHRGDCPSVDKYIRRRYKSERQLDQGVLRLLNMWRIM